MRIVEPGQGLVRLEYQVHVPDILVRRQDAELSLGMEWRRQLPVWKVTPGRWRDIEFR